ncbi:MAG TPA: DUF1850 domain-containing protein [Shinella sp.]|uniref:DUF1850 domain-containing protein n=1 Tax=Shinella sp. TaxID=1870904 RepID=UPI0029A3DED4|nr:DUF1850 domain-containing protein [Shinella sp.]MDX3978487.1 DUF1850 domain-containing protein [Shinella sp.]HEV7247583.1 DUF1850 domain-containing protein [Shinella sp.]
MSAMLCIAGGKTIAVAAGLFTLSWTHSVEKVEWRENWQATPAGLVLREARVKGSGAGMEPGEGARRKDGWWVWNPHVAPLADLVLASSGATVSGWTLCDATGCQELGRREGEPLVLRACAGRDAGAMLHREPADEATRGRVLTGG